jgi:N utilization substance protein B
MKKARRAARELALNVLYQTDACAVPFDEALDTALEFADLGSLVTKRGDKTEEAREYARILATGVVARMPELDRCIAELSEGWPLERQPPVDRNILRIAIYEIKHVDSVPPVVAVDEAVEMAKKFSTAESSKFVNGVLAGYLKQEKVLNPRHPEESVTVDNQRHPELDSGSSSVDAESSSA